MTPVCSMKKAYSAMKPSTVSSPKSAESTADIIGGTLCSRWCLAFSKTMVTVTSMVTMAMVDCRSRKVVSPCPPWCTPPSAACVSTGGFSVSHSDKSKAPPSSVAMRSIIPKCRFNARGTPNFGLILTGGVPVLTLGEPVRPEGDAKPLEADEAGGRLFEGDFGMPRKDRRRRLRRAKRLFWDVEKRKRGLAIYAGAEPERRLRHERTPVAIAEFSAAQVLPTARANFLPHYYMIGCSIIVRATYGPSARPNLMAPSTCTAEITM